MRVGQWVQGIVPMRHDAPEVDPDDRTILLGASVETSPTLAAAPPVPLNGTIGHAHACMAYLGPDPQSQRALGAWSNVFPLVAAQDPKRGLGLRVIRDAQGRAGDADIEPIDVVGLPVFDRAIMAGDEAIALGTPKGGVAPVVMPGGALPLALPLAEDAVSLANYTTRAAFVSLDARGVAGQIPRACRLSSALVCAARGGDNVAMNGTRTGAMIDLELAGGGGTITRTGTRAIETHRLDRVLVGGRGFALDPHGDAAHISCEAPIIALDAPEFDGPLAFERGYDDGAREGTIPHRVHRRFERVSGRWVDHVAIPVYQDDDPPPGPPPEDPREPGEPEVPPPIPPETPGGGGIPPGIPDPRTPPLPPPGTEDPFPPGTGGLVQPLPFDPFNPPRKGRGEGTVESSYARPSAGSPHEWHAPGIAFRATPTAGAGQGGDFRAPRGRMSAAQVARARSAPISLHIEGYGAETDGGRFVAAGNRGAASRRYAYAEGTAGGAVVLPPELGLEHIRDLDTAYARELPSVAYLTFASTYARLGLGKPDVSGRGLKSGFSIYEKGSNNLYIDNHDANGVATLIATWESDGSLDLRSGDLTTTDANIVGALNHDGAAIGFFGVAPIAQADAITSPSGGVVIDAEARSSIDEIRALLTAYGLTP